MQVLHDWFLECQRTFPWREDPTPYKVWISEVMLQQTRASVVVSYFERWIQRFPDVATLAAASLEEVIKLWEGLGYYSRARNLYQGAQEILRRFGGQIPSTKEELLSIRGIGPYTVGAILSFGFKKKAVAVDGNVLRVIARLFSIEENICTARARRKIAEKAEQLLDPQAPWITMEALIELGALICTLKPRCEICPLQEKCLGKHKAHLLPIKNVEQEITHLERAVIWLEVEEEVLVQKGEKGKVMADLYQFPYFEKRTGIKKIIQQTFGIDAELIEILPTVTHTFTRFKAKLYPFRFRGKVKKEIAGYEWIPRAKLKDLPFSAGHRRILAL